MSDQRPNLRFIDKDRTPDTGTVVVGMKQIEIGFNEAELRRGVYHPEARLLALSRPGFVLLGPDFKREVPLGGTPDEPVGKGGKK